MKTLLPLLSVSFILAADAAACDCGKTRPLPAVSAAETAEPKSHPVKGVVTGLLPEKTALLVKHEEVPGVMRAMTMMFRVEPAVLRQVKAGDAITARMARRQDGWWLTEVQPAPKL